MADTYIGSLISVQCTCPFQIQMLKFKGMGVEGGYHGCQELYLLENTVSESMVEKNHIANKYICLCVLDLWRGPCLILCNLDAQVSLTLSRSLVLSRLEISCLT